MSAAVSPFGTKRSRRWIPWLSIAVPSIGWLVFGLYPSIATFFYSFTQYSGLPGTPLNVCGLCNYKTALTTLLPTVGKSLWVTLVFAIGVTAAQTVLALALALLMQRRGKIYSLYRALIFLPGVLSVAIVGGVFSLILDPESGVVARIGQHLGVHSAYLGSDSTALYLVMAINVWMGTGYAMIIFIAGLRAVPSDTYEAAALDSAGRFRTFWHVTWPLLAPATTVNVFLAVMATIGDYALILVLTDGNFGTQTLGVYMFNSAFGTNNQLGYGSMLAILQFLLTVIVGGILLVVLRRREVTL